MFLLRPSTLLGLALGLGPLALRMAVAEPADTTAARKVPAVVNRKEEPLVDIAKACPGIVVELRYATARNLTGKPIYPAGARALTRQSVAERLNQAQHGLHDMGFGLKVWDAYRPPWVQKILWNAVRNPAFVVEPSSTGSLHSWGVAVDVTLIDFRGRDVPMPTDFDAFTIEARYDYRGQDPVVAFNVKILKNAMADAGFRHIRDEWWHYSTVDSMTYGPLDVSLEGSPELAKSEPAATPAPGPEPPPPASTVVLFPPPTPTPRASVSPPAPTPKKTMPAAPKERARPLFPPHPEETL